MKMVTGHGRAQVTPLMRCALGSRLCFLVQKKHSSWSLYTSFKDRKCCSVSVIPFLDVS